MRLAVTMFILGVGTSPCSRAWASKSNTMNAGVGGGRPLTSPAPGSVGRRSTISYDQAKTSSSSTERTNDAPRYSYIHFNSFSFVYIDASDFNSVRIRKIVTQSRLCSFLCIKGSRHWICIRSCASIFVYRWRNINARVAMNVKVRSRDPVSAMVNFLHLLMHTNKRSIRNWIFCSFFVD